MDFGDVIVLLVLIVIFVAGGIKRIIQSLVEQTESATGRQGGYEASAQEVRDFLRQIAGGEQPQRKPAERPERRPEGRRPERVQPVAGPRRAAAERAAPPPRAPRTRTPRARRPRRKERPARKPVRKHEVTGRKPAAPEKEPERGALPALPGRGRAGLRQAVIWSEILGPPVSMRRLRHHVPPVAEQD